MALAGIWSPATINTATVGTTTYTFTPTDPCATVVTMNVTISTQVTPTFTQIGPLCPKTVQHRHFLAHQTMALPEPGVQVQLILQQLEQQHIRLHQLIHVLQQPQWILQLETQITPTFTQIGPLCQNSTAPTLPATSDNGFAGTWSPATINTTTVGTTTYTFTPTDACATVDNYGYYDWNAGSANLYANRTTLSE
jgi:hypothetical protein